MHSLKAVSGILGSDTLPGIMLLLLSVMALFVWEVVHLTGGQAVGGRHRVIPRLIGLAAVVMGAASFVFMAARFIWVA